LIDPLQIEEKVRAYYFLLIVVPGREPAEGIVMQKLAYVNSLIIFTPMAWASVYGTALN
jgi:hypothetical protein